MCLCIWQTQTCEQAHETGRILGFWEAPRVVAANIDLDLQETTGLFATFLPASSRVDLEMNSLASPPTVDILTEQQNVLLCRERENDEDLKPVKFWKGSAAQYDCAAEPSTEMCIDK